MENVVVLENVIREDIGLFGKFTIGDVPGNAKRFRNVFDAEDGEFKLVGFRVAHWT